MGVLKKFSLITFEENILYDIKWNLNFSFRLQSDIENSRIFQKSITKSSGITFAKWYIPKLCINEHTEGYTCKYLYENQISRQRHKENQMKPSSSKKKWQASMEL